MCGPYHVSVLLGDGHDEGGDDASLHVHDVGGLVRFGVQAHLEVLSHHKLQGVPGGRTQMGGELATYLLRPPLPSRFQVFLSLQMYIDIRDAYTGYTQ